MVSRGGQGSPPKHEVSTKTESMWKLKWERKFDDSVYKVTISSNGQYVSAEVSSIEEAVGETFLALLSTNGGLLWIKGPYLYGGK